MGIDWKQNWDRSETEKLADMASMAMVISAAETLLKENPSVREAGTFEDAQGICAFLRGSVKEPEQEETRKKLKELKTRAAKLHLRLPGFRAEASDAEGKGGAKGDGKHPEKGQKAQG